MKIFLFVCVYFLGVLGYYTENANYQTFSLPTENDPYQDTYCGALSGNLCSTCYSATETFNVLNDNKRCLYNKDKLTDIFYDPTTSKAYVINPYCMIIPSTSSDLLNDLSQFPSSATVSSTSFTYECAQCHEITTPTQKKYGLKPAYYTPDGSRKKNFCVVESQEVPFAVKVQDLGYFAGPYKTGSPSCGSDCLSCTGSASDGSDLACRECSYSMNRYADLSASLTTVPPTFSSQIKNTGLGCSSASSRSSSSDFGNFFISSTEFSCVGSGNCDGSYSKPFESLAALSIYLHNSKAIGSYSEVTLNVYFMKGTHFVLDKYIPTGVSTPSYSFLNEDSSANYYQDMLLLRIFERVSVTATFSSAYRGYNGCTSTSYCLEAGEMATIVWKSHLTSFWISKKLQFSNLVVEFSDMFPFSGDNSDNTFTYGNNYMYKKQQCCVCDAAGSCSPSTGLASNNCFCGKTSQSLPKSFSSKRYQEFNSLGTTYYRWHKRPYGFFNMDFLSDYSSAANPELDIEVFILLFFFPFIKTLNFFSLIKSCIFKNFRFHLYSPSLIAISRNFASTIKIKDSVFQNFYHPYGLISNAYVPWLRDAPYFVPTAPQMCSEKSLSDPCYYLLLNNCTFNISGKNASFFAWDTESDQSLVEYIDSVQNEGIVLFLNNFNGPITLLSCSFLNLVTILRKNTSECSLDTLDSTFQTYSEQSVFMDYLIKSLMENADTNSYFTGSILNIRNLRFGLTIKDCVFKDNVGFSGVGLFLHQFDIDATSGKHSAILLEDNVFQGNFAFRYGLSAVILNNERDFVNLMAKNKCSGIQINGNVFRNNAGCPKTFGNLVVSCFPAEISGKEAPYGTYDSITTVSKSTYTLAYLFGKTIDENNFNYATDDTYSFRFLMEQYFNSPFSNNNITWQVPPSPETSSFSESLDLSTINIFDNLFANNYAIISNGLFMSGIPSVNLINNSFINNSIPVSGSSIYKVTGILNNIFPSGINGLSFSPSLGFYESSALMIGLSMKIWIRNCLWRNNSASLGSNWHYGLGITLNHMIGVRDILIENCSFENHQNDGFNRNKVNNMSLISLNYLEYYNGFTFTTSALNPTVQHAYYRNFVSNFTIRTCKFKLNSFQIIDSTSIDVNTAAIVSFYTEVKTNSGNYKSSTDYSSTNQYSPSTDYYLTITNSTFSEIYVYDNRPLVSFFYNNFVSVSNLTFTSIVLSEIKDYSGYLSLYLVDSSYDFSFKTYQITITAILVSNSKGIILSINHPIEKTSNQNPTPEDLSSGILELREFLIESHSTLNSPICLGKLNMLSMTNVTFRKITTYYGILAFKVAQTTILEVASLLLIQNLAASEITTYKFGGLYLNGVYNCEMKNISLSNIVFIFSDLLVQENAAVHIGVCLFVSQYMPYLQNFTCSNLEFQNSIANIANFANLALSSFGICMGIKDVTKTYTKNGSIPNSNEFVCEVSKGNLEFNPDVYGLALGVISSSSGISLSSAQFRMHQSLSKGIYVYGTVQVSFSYLTFANLQISSSQSSSMAFVIGGLSSVTLTNSLMQSNECPSCLGLIQVLDISKLTLDNITVTQNSASDSTVLLLKGSSICSIANSVFSYNKGLNGTSMISSFLSQITITGSVFIENRALINGFKFIETTFTITTCKFIRNYADSKSSDFYISVNSQTSTFWDCDFQAGPTFFNSTPRSNQKGHFLFISEAEVLIQYCFFSNGYSYLGGAIYFSSASERKLTVQDSQFKNNSVYDHGGAVYISGKAIFERTEFLNNSCLQSGKGSNIYLASSSVLNLSNCFLNNSLKGSLYVDQDGIAEIITTEFQGVYTGEGIPIHAISCNLCSYLSISFCLIRNFRQIMSEGAGIIVTGQTSVNDYDGTSLMIFLLANSSLINCTSSQGSALYITGVVQANITGSIFKENSAISSNSSTGNGGALYLSCTNLYCQIQLFASNSFISNHADIAGGAHYFSIVSLIFLDTTTYYYNNSAIYGNNQASYAVKLEMYQDPPSWLTNSITRRLSSVQVPAEYSILTSGSIITPIPVIKILDEFGQIVSSDNTSILTVTAASSSDTVNFANDSIFTAYQGYYVLYPFSILYTPGLTPTVKFTSSAVVPKFQRTDLSFDTSLNFSKSLRQCLRGEKRSNNLACIACPENSYSTYDYTETSYSGTVSCLSCPSNGYCRGYYLAGPMFGYWKYNSYSNSLFECYNSEACLGSNASNFTGLFCKEKADIDESFCFTGWCAEGYQGNMCEDCWDGWAQSNPVTRTCVQCNDNPGYYVKSIFISIGSIAFIVWSVWNKISANKKAAKERARPSTIIEPLEQEFLDRKENGNKVYPEKKNDIEEGENSNLIISSSLVKARDDTTPKEDFVPEKKDDISDKDMEKSSPTPNNPDAKESPGENSLIQKEKSLKTVQIIERIERKPSDLMEESTAKTSETQIKDRSSIYVKILFNYIQILAILGTFPFEWPTELSNLFSDNKEAQKSSQSFFSIDCFLKEDVFSRVGLRVFFTKLMLYAVSPIAFLLICYVVWILYYYAKFKKNMKAHKNEFEADVITSMVVLLFMFHPNILQQDFDAFSCINFKDDTELGYSSVADPQVDKYYLQVDNQIKCWDSYHISWCLQIATPSLIFWGIGIPVLAFYMLFKNRFKLYEIVTYSKYSFLYEGYQNDKYYWEFVILSRKILIIVSSVFLVTAGPQIQGAFVMGVSAINYLLQVWMEPYDQDGLNELEKRSLICSAFTFYCALFYIQSDVAGWYKVFLLVLILLLNCYFGWFWLKEFIRQKTWVLESEILTKRFVKGRHNVFDFDLRWVQQKKEMIAGKQMLA